MNDIIWDHSIGIAQGLCPVILAAAILDAPKSIVVSLVATMLAACLIAAATLICGMKPQPIQPDQMEGGENDERQQVDQR